MLLTELLAQSQPPVSGEFRPYCEYSKSADAINVYFSGDADYSERLTEHVTLFLSIDKKEIVGCRIKGIAGIMEYLPNYINVEHGDVTISVLFLPLRAGQDTEKSKKFDELATHAKPIKLSEVQECLRLSVA